MGAMAQPLRLCHRIVRTLQNSPKQQEGVEKTTKSDSREHLSLARASALLLAFMYTCWTVELGKKKLAFALFKKKSSILPYFPN